jgi:F-type H+-transporting ATPase subunit b
MNRSIISLLILTMSSPAFASGGTYVSQSVNFILLAVILFVVAWKNVPTLLENRAQDIEYNIQKGQKDLEIAQTRHEEVMENIQNLDQKLSEITEQAENDISAMKQKMDTQLVKEKERIAIGTKRSVQDELNRVKHELKQESAELAIQMATNILKEKITADDQQKISNHFVKVVTLGEDNVQ